MSASEDKIDPDSLAALKKLLLQFPGGINAIGDLSKRRLALNSITKKITEIEHSDIEVRDFLVPSSNQDRNIALRAYSAKNGRDNELKPCLFYVHGGGMIMGDLETGNLQCLSFASRFNLIVIAIDYRKSPEFPYPAAINDCFDGITWIASNCELFNIDPTNIGIYGSSAGGGLALGTALKIRDAGLAILLFEDLEPSVLPVEIAVNLFCQSAAAVLFWHFRMVPLPARHMDAAALPGRDVAANAHV